MRRMAEDGQPQRGDAFVSALPWLLLFALATALALQRIQSADYWWLLRTGQLIAETGSVPRADDYTFTVAGERWVDIHWIFQLGLWGLFRLGGHAATVLGKLGLIATVLVLLAPIGWRRQRQFVSIGALALLLLVACDRFMPRPEVFSWVLLAAVLRILDRFERTGDRWIWAIVPLQLLWVNVHGLFALGIAVCAMHLMGELARPLGEAGARPSWQRVWPLAAVTALSALVSLFNPNGLDGALYPVQQLAMVGSAEARGFFGHVIIELQPTFGALSPLALVFLLTLIALSLASLALNWRAIPLSDPLLWVAFFYLVMGARRNVPLFAIVVVPMLVRNWNAWLDGRALPERLPRLAGVLLSVVLAALAVDAARGRLFPRMSQLRVPGLGVDWPSYPTVAADWIERHRPPGPIAHSMMDGGFLIWRLYPDYRVMADGRLEIFGPELFRELLIDSTERFAALDAEYRFGVVVHRHGPGNARELLAHWVADPEWRFVAVDDAAALFVRATPGQAFLYPEPDLEVPGLFPPLDGSIRERDRLFLHRRTAFFSTLGRDDLALAVWEEALRLFPDIEQGQHIRRMLLQSLGRDDAPR
ncbi:MAG: hypothetical protein JRS35_14845 [Deltaproteobacteria bacterium]|nr:hypothetical protein [Deltaproteobacteria bacterium]